MARRAASSLGGRLAAQVGFRFANPEIASVQGRGIPLSFTTTLITENRLVSVGMIRLA
jgi:hypothetical protein